MIDLHTVVRKAEKEIAKNEAIKKAATDLLAQLGGETKSANGNGAGSPLKGRHYTNSIHSRVLRVYASGDPLTPGQAAKRIGTSRRKVAKCIMNNTHEFERVDRGVYKLR